MFALSFLFAALALFPLALFAGTAFRGETKVSRVSVLLCALLGAMLIARPHAHTFGAPDPACLRHMALAFSSGSRSLCGINETLSKIPEQNRTDFYYRTAARPTADLCFERTFTQNSAAFTYRPYFLAAFPLAASFFDRIGVGADSFLPFCTTLFLALCFFCYGRTLKKIPLLLSVLLCTYLPAYFFRGFHSEAMSTLLVCTPLVYGLGAPQPRRFPFLSGFLLAYSLLFHFSALLLALPAAIFLLFRAASKTYTKAFLCGSAAGILLLAAFLSHTGSPYFVFSLSWFRTAVQNVAQFRITALLFLGSVLCLALFALGMAVSPIRRTLFSFAARHKKLLCRLCCGGILLFFAFLWTSGGKLNRGFIQVGNSLVFAAPFLLATLVLLWIRPQKALQAMLLFALCAAFAMGCYYKAIEVDVGLWSMRRIFPPVFAMSLMCLHVLREVPSSRGRIVCYAFLSLCALGSLFFFGKAYLFCGEPDIRKNPPHRLLQELPEAPVFCNYIDHSMPLQTTTRFSVIGLGRHARDRQFECFRLFAQGYPEAPFFYFIDSYETPPVCEGYSFEALRSYESPHTQLKRPHHFSIVERAPKCTRMKLYRATRIPSF